MNSSYSQFTAPFNILPDIVYTNPTNKYSDQFTRPYNILPDTIYPNPTSRHSQFIPPFNILPDKIYDNPTATGGTQFIPQQPAAPGYAGNPTANVSPTTQTITLPAFMGGGTITTTRTQFSSYNTSSAVWATPTEFIHTNVSLKTVASNIFGFASLAGASYVGIPQIGQVGQSIVNGVENSLSGTYKTMPINNLSNKLFTGTNINSPVLYSDFRSRLTIAGNTDVGFGQQALSYVTSRRLDGLSAAGRGSIIGGIYAAASATPIGPYSTFNLDGFGPTGYGWGEHDHPNAIRSDFTMRSHVAKRWKRNPARLAGEFIDSDANGNILNTTRKIEPPVGEFVPTFDPIELATPFRGDKVNVIDFGKRSLSEAYLWKPNRLPSAKGLGALLNKAGITQDFIKFYFTGPNIVAGDMDTEDDIIVFRAIITTFSDSFSPVWVANYMIGRADPNYIYNGVTRDVSLNFDIYATDRDEMQSIYRKLNALAGYTAPRYDADSISMDAPWMRLTIGDLFVQTPVVLNSLSFDYAVSDAPWEINIERDPNMMQVPFKIGVTCQFNVISDFLPQQGGRFYTLAKRFAIDGSPAEGNDNWLSDAKGNISREEVKRKFKTAKGKVTGKTTKKTETNKIN